MKEKANTAQVLYLNKARSITENRNTTENSLQK